MGGDSSTSMKELPEMCSALDSTERELVPEGKTSPTPRSSAVIPSHGTENKKWQQTGEGPVVFKAGCTVSLCLRRFRAVVIYEYCTQFCFREYFQLLFHSAQMIHEGN